MPRADFDKQRAPGEPREGARVDGRKHGVWIEADGKRVIEVGYLDGARHGPYLRWRADGTLLEEGVYERGERVGGFVIHAREQELTGTHRDGGRVVDGAFERRDTVRTEWVRERGRLQDGRREGVWEEYYLTGAPMIRVEYRAGVADGLFEQRWHAGEPWITGQNAGGAPVGRWVHRRADGSVAAEVDYDAGGVVRWRWLRRDGSERPDAPAVRGREDVERWIALGDAWERAVDACEGTYAVESAVNHWPEDEQAPALAWIDAQPARPALWPAGPWLQVLLDRDDDPRARYVNLIQVDHAEWDEAQVARLCARAEQFVELSLDECWVHPGVERLFEPGVSWSRLRVLWLHDCDALDAAIARLATADWAGTLRTLYLGGHDTPPSAAALAPLFTAPWLDALAELALDVRGDPAPVVAALAARALPALRRLALRFDDEYPVDLAPLRRPGLELTG